MKSLPEISTIGGKALWRSLLASCMLVIPATAIFAQDEEEPVLLGTITLSATHTPNLSFDLPASVTTIGRKAFEDSGAWTLSGALKGVPNLNYAGGARAQAQSPAIRGFSGPKIILTVDGVRRNFEGGVHAPLLLEPDFVRQADVVRGPMSAIYGSGGLGGVLAFTTITADDVLAEGQTIGGSAKLGYRSANDSASANLTAAARLGAADLLFSGTWRGFGRIKTGAEGTHADYPGDGNLQSGLLKFGYDLNAENRFELSWLRFGDDVIAPSNPGANNTSTLMQRLERDQEDLRAAWIFGSEDNPWFDGQLTIYNSAFDLAGESLVGQPDVTWKTETRGLSLRNTSRFDLGASSHRLTYGFDWYEDELRNTSGGVANSVTPDGSMESLGFYVQDEVAIGTDWTVIAALRHDRYDMRSPGQADTSHDRLSPKLALRYSPNETLGLYASYGEAFRAPTMTEMFSNLSTDRALFNFRPNPDLKPELAKTFEIGATLDFQDLLAPGDGLQAKLSVFTEDVSNLIESRTVGTFTRLPPFTGTGLIFQRQNVAEAERWGGELTLDYRRDDLTVSLGYAKLRAKDSATGAGLYAPPDKLSLGASWQVNDQWALHYAGQFVSAQDYDGTVLRRRAGYGVHDLGVTWQNDLLRVDFGISNIFDKAYATYHQSQADTFSYEEGRSFNLFVTRRF